VILLLGGWIILIFILATEQAGVSLQASLVHAYNRSLFFSTLVFGMFCVFNDNNSNSDYVASNESVIVNIEFGRDVKEAVVTQFELLFLYFA
jgi:hypothetical protein